MKKTFNFIFCALLGVMLTTTLTSCEKDNNKTGGEVELKSIKVDAASYTADSKGEVGMTFTVEPSDAKVDGIAVSLTGMNTLKSSDANVLAAVAAGSVNLKLGDVKNLGNGKYSGKIVIYSMSAPFAPKAEHSYDFRFAGKSLKLGNVNSNEFTVVFAKAKNLEIIKQSNLNHPCYRVCSRGGLFNYLTIFADNHLKTKTL